MLKSVFRWSLLVGAVLFVGPVASQLLANLRAADGGSGTTILTAFAPGQGIIAAFVLFASALVVGGLGAAAFARETGLAAAGFVTAWGAWRLGSTEAAVMVAGGRNVLLVLAAEGAAVGFAFFLIAMFIGIVSRREHADHPAAGPVRVARLFIVDAEPDVNRNRVLAVSALVGIITGGAAGWLVAFEPQRGQAVFAAIAAGIAAAAGVQLTASGLRAKAGFLAPFISMGLLAVLAPVVCYFTQGDKIVQVCNEYKLMGLARVISLDWAAGALLGVPIGLGWVGSMIEKPHPVTA